MNQGSDTVDPAPSWEALARQAALAARERSWCTFARAASIYCCLVVFQRALGGLAGSRHNQHASTAGVGPLVSTCVHLPCSKAADFEGYAFKEGEDTTLEEFEKSAHSFERQWFGSEARASKVS